MKLTPNSEKYNYNYNHNKLIPTKGYGLKSIIYMES
jgi:hypothetical protein